MLDRLVHTYVYWSPITLIENSADVVWSLMEQAIREDNNLPDSIELDMLTHQVISYDKIDNLLEIECSMLKEEA